MGAQRAWGPDGLGCEPSWGPIASVCQHFAMQASSAAKHEEVGAHACPPRGAHLPAVTRVAMGHAVGTGLGMPGGAERSEGGAGEDQGECSL